MSGIYEELMEIYTNHLIYVHGSTMSACELHDEQIFMEDFLYNEPLSADIRQEISCPIIDCAWVQHFYIIKRVQIEKYQGEEE